MDKLHRALGIFYDLEEKLSISKALNNIALSYLKLEQLDSTHIYAQRAFDLQADLKDEHGQTISLTTIAQVFLRRGVLSKALAYCNHAFELAQKNAFQEELKDLYHCYSRIYEARGDYARALAYFKQYKDVRDSIFNEQKLSELKTVQLRYELAKDSIQQAQFDLVVSKKEYTIRQQRQQTYFALGGLIFFVALAFVLIRQRRQEQLLRKAQEERSLILNEKREELLTQNQQLIMALKGKDQLTKSSFDTQTITLTNKEKHSFKLAQLLYLKTAGSAVKFYVQDEQTQTINEIWEWQSLKAVRENLLPNDLFIQIHRSYVVNVQHVKSISTSEVLMIDGERFTVGRKYKENARKLLK